MYLSVGTFLATHNTAGVFLQKQQVIKINTKTLKPGFARACFQKKKKKKTLRVIAVEYEKNIKCASWLNVPWSTPCYYAQTAFSATCSLGTGKKKDKVEVFWGGIIYLWSL